MAIATPCAEVSQGAHWDERVEMMKGLSDYLNALRDGAKLKPFERRRSRRAA